jgi:hypothetical protein
MEIRDDLHPTIKQLLVDFRRVQVSRFPIIVESNNADEKVVKFVDSRFPTDTWRKDRMLAWLGINDHDDKGRPILTLYSRLIKNEKYSTHNEDYFTKSTFDVKKMGSYLRQYVKPYNSEEIMERIPKPEYEHSEWMQEPQTAFYNVAREVRPEVVAQEIMYLQSMGVQFKTNEFREMATQGLELYGEAQRRRNANLIMINVFIQPDGSVLVGWPHSSSAPMGSVTYENMDSAPEIIQQKIAMLKMCEQNKFVPELGRMTTTEKYWLVVSPDEFNFSNT